MLAGRPRVVGPCHRLRPRPQPPPSVASLLLLHCVMLAGRHWCASAAVLRFQGIFWRLRTAGGRPVAAGGRVSSTSPKLPCCCRAGAALAGTVASDSASTAARDSRCAARATATMDEQHQGDISGLAAPAGSGDARGDHSQKSAGPSCRPGSPPSETAAALLAALRPAAALGLCRVLLTALLAGCTAPSLRAGLHCGSDEM